VFAHRNCFTLAHNRTAQPDGRMREMPSLTQRAIWQGTGQQRAAWQGTEWAAEVSALLQGISGRVGSLEEAEAYALAVAAVYERVRAEKRKLRWGHMRLARHMAEQRFYANYFNRLRRHKPGHLTGPIHVMYGGAAWGPIKGSRRGPVKGVRKRFEREPGFVVHEVHEHLTSMTDWATGARLSVVGMRGEDGVVRQVRGLLRLPAKNNTTSGPPAYVNRDFNAACNILRAGILPQRPAHLCAGQPKVDREIKSLLRPRRPQPTGAVQEAAGMAGEGPGGEEVGWLGWQH
jgi:hypothetical protein